MKFLSKAIATVALIAVPTMAQAQFQATTVRAIGWPINVGNPSGPTGGGGGQFRLQTSLLGNILAYCIDDNRSAPFDNTENYRMYTFAQYVADASLSPAFGNSQFISELNAMAVNAGIIAANGDVPVSDAAQIQTWAWFDAAGAQGGTPMFNNAGWVVFVAEAAVTRDGSVRGGQTFIAQTVPEPSTYALMGVGLFAISIVARRRRQA